MKTIAMMDSSGDSPVSFEPNTNAEQKARELFARVQAGGGAVFAVERGPSLEDKKVTQFDELEEQNVAFLRIVGG